MKQENLIEMRSRIPQTIQWHYVDIPPSREERRNETWGLLLRVAETLTTAAIGICCVACMVLVYTML